MKESGEIGAGRHAHTSKRLLDGAGAANAGTALDHEHAQAGSSEVGRAGETIVSGADDDHVPGFGPELADGDGQPDFAEQLGSG
jgi:hypothetical protein